MNELETLCRPLILRMCELRVFSRAGAVREMDEIAAEIKRELADIKTKCAENISLARDFSYVEKPLAFFIDYSVREGKFDFSRSWRDIAREYGELSGDEKFFDMLAATLDDPNAKERIEIFYILIGLGFDGMYKREPETVERKMKVCATRMDAMLDITKEPVTVMPSAVAEKQPRKKFFSAGMLTLVVSVFFLFVAFGFNYYVFYRETGALNVAITKALTNASTHVESDRSLSPEVKNENRD